MKILAWPAFKTKYKNPYNWLLYSNMQKIGAEIEEFSVRQAMIQHYDIFHLHWPVETIVRHPNPMIAFNRAWLMLKILDYLRWRGTKIVWTIHDATPHSIVHAKIAAWFEQNLLHRLDGLISLCESSKVFVAQNFPELKSLPHTVIPHGHYRDIYPNECSPAIAKAHLGIPFEQPILLFLGYIDYYKNVPALVEAFHSLQAAHWHLVIAGNVAAEELKEKLLNLAEKNDHIHLHLRFIPDDQLQIYYQAASLVVLPFAEILNSGSALLALSFNCPILVPHKGALASLKKAIREDWVKLYDGNFSADTLATGLQWATQTSRSPEVDLSKFDWNFISQQTLLFYQQLATY